MKAGETRQTKGLLFYALLCACLGVWGHVFYQIAHGLNPVGDPFGGVSLTPPPGMNASSTLRRPGSMLSYNSAYRDPFARPPALFVPRPSPPRRRAQPPSEPPPLSLSGVVDATALLQGDDGSAYVARAGEHAGHIQVVTVQRDHVVVRFRGRSHTLHLAQ